MKNKIIVWLLAFTIFLPLTALASDIVSLTNPLGNTNSVPELINNMVRGLLGVTGSLALFFVVQGGVTWIMSGGNADKVKAGKEAIKWSILGLLAIFLSYVVVSIVFASIESF